MATRTRKPLQIYLEADQERVLRALAERERVSLAELIRRSVDHYLAELLPSEADPSLGLVGLGHGGPQNLSTSHDELVAGQVAVAPDE